MTVALPRSTRSDSELVESIAAGDLDALGTLFDRHEAALRRFFARLGMSGADTDDLVQATFLEVMRAAPRFDRNLPLLGWLYGLASIMARRHRRTLARTAQRLLGWASLTWRESPSTPAAELDRDQELRRFQLALERLSLKKREVFVLIVLEGLSGEEAARALRVPVNTVWTRLHHARRELRHALEQAP
jgi:RNA polymerase sigma-70 factor (ECF subfamily)